MFGGGVAVRFFRVGLLLGVLVALGCNDAATGPTTSEFNEKRVALKAKVAAKKAGGSQANKPRRVAKVHADSQLLP